MDATKTREKLEGLPFKSVTQLNRMREHVHMSAWLRLENARLTKDLLNRPEYAFVKEEFEKGMACCDGATEEKQIFRVYGSEKNGVVVDVNRALIEKSPIPASSLGAMMEAISTTFTNVYYKARGLLPSELDVGLPKREE